MGCWARKTNKKSKQPKPYFLLLVFVLLCGGLLLGGLLGLLALLLVERAVLEVGGDLGNGLVAVGLLVAGSGSLLLLLKLLDFLVGLFDVLRGELERTHYIKRKKKLKKKNGKSDLPAVSGRFGRSPSGPAWP